MIDSLYTPRDQKNYAAFARWMIGAAVTFAVATIAIDGGFIPSVAGWSLTIVFSVLAAVAMRAYIRFLRAADELLRKVHLESLAFAFGAGLVVVMTYRLCERLGAPKLDVNDGALVMLVAWIGGQWIGSRRYATEEEGV